MRPEPYHKGQRHLPDLTVSEFKIFRELIEVKKNFRSSR